MWFAEARERVKFGNVFVYIKVAQWILTIELVLHPHCNGHKDPHMIKLHKTKYTQTNECI